MIQRIGNSQSSSSSSSIVVIPSSLSRDADDAIQEPFHSFLSPEFSPAYPTKIGRKRQRQIESHCNDDGTDRSCDSVAAVLDNLNQKAAAIAFAVGQKQDELFAEDSSESSDDAADDSGEGIPQKTKVVKATSGRSANTGGRDLVRRNQSPACRYELVRIALLRFRELNGNTYVKRGFVVPKESSDWPEETWGIRLDLVSYVKHYRPRRSELKWWRVTCHMYKQVQTGFSMRGPPTDTICTYLQTIRTF